MQEKENYSSQEFKKMLNKLPNEIRVFEHGIKGNTMEEYRALSAQITEEERSKELNFLDLDLHLEQNKEPAKRKKVSKPRKLSERSLVSSLKKPQNWEKSEIFKRNIIHAANLASIDIYRFLNTLVDIVPIELQEWVYAAIMQCQMHLENSLMDEPVGFIATALGGKGHRIRYYFAVTSMKSMDENAISIVFNTYTNLASSYDIEIEETSCNSEFILFRVLVPYNKMITEFITDGTEAIHALNEPEFWITNMIHPSTTDLKAWVDAKKSQTQQ